MKSGKKLLEECVRMILLLAAVSIVAFLLITKAPIDPLISYVGTNSTLSEEAKEEIAEEWGLNTPLPERFITWVKHALHGDLGMSITYKKPVIEVIKTRFSYSIVLMMLAWVLSGIIGFILGVVWHGDLGMSITYKKPVIEVIKTRFSYSIVLMMLAWVLSGIIGFILGVVCGMRQGRILDKIVKTFCLVIKSAPVFWIGLLVLTIFAVQLGWFPIGMAVPAGKLAADVTLGDRIYHLILPVLTLTIVSVSEVVLYTRQKVIENVTFCVTLPFRRLRYSLPPLMNYLEEWHLPKQYLHIRA